MTGQGGGLPLSSPSFCTRPTFPLRSCGQLSFPFSGRLEVHNKGPACFASSPTCAACSNPPTVEEVSLLLLSGRSVPVSGYALWVVSEPESLHQHSRCDDGPYSVTGLSSPPLSGQLAPEESTVGPPQDSDTRPSSLNNQPRLDSQSGVVRVSSNSRL